MSNNTMSLLLFFLWKVPSAQSSRWHTHDPLWDECWGTYCAVRSWPTFLRESSIMQACLRSSMSAFRFILFRVSCISRRSVWYVCSFNLQRVQLILICLLVLTISNSNRTSKSFRKAIRNMYTNIHFSYNIALIGNQLDVGTSGNIN